MQPICIKCETNIKVNSIEHDNCILVNDGEDLVCEECVSESDYESDSEEVIYTDN